MAPRVIDPEVRLDLYEPRRTPVRTHQELADQLLRDLAGVPLEKLAAKPGASFTHRLLA
jgi:hypothetical protein